MVEGRSKQAFKTWLADRPQEWRDGVEVVAMDGFTGFKTAAVEELPDVVTVLDPFHVTRLAGEALDECRRRVQQAICGHRGRAAGVYRVVFEYADGSLKVLEGDAQAEGPVWAGEAEKVGGSDFLNQVRGRWLDQRLAVGGPDEEAIIHSMACPAPDHYLVAHPLEDVLAGWICDASSAEVWQSALEPSLAQQIAGEIRDNSTPVDGNLPITDVSVSLMVSWGEATALRMLTNEPGFLWVSEQGAMQYQPSADVEREIASLLNA